MIIRFLIAACLMFSNLLMWAKDGVVLFPVANDAVRSKTFSVSVNSKTVFVQQFKDIHYVHFAHKGKVRLEIKSVSSIEGYVISPQSGTKAIKAGSNIILLDLDKPGYYVVTLVNQDRLIILADAITSDEPKKSDRLNVAQLGIDGSGKEIITALLQQAINESVVREKVLYFPSGIYRTGTLRIPSNARIYLSAGALIKGSENREDYPVDLGKKESDQVHDKANYTDNGEWMTFSRLLLIDSASNVRLWGNGTIDGSGSVVRAQGKPANLMRIRNSNNIRIEGLILRDPACWNTHILHSENVTIRNVKLLNDRSVANTDGFDPDASKHVLIEHCFAYCSDDNIAIKTTNNGGLLQNCEDIQVKNCVFLTKKSALKLGTETKAALMQNILFEGNYVVEADRGMVLYCYDGATFQNIRFINNYFERGFADNQRKAIHFQVKNRNGGGQIKNVLIQDCIISSGFHQTSEMTGLDAQHLIEGVSIKNLKLGDKVVSSIEDLHLKSNNYVQNIKIEN